MTDMRDDDWRNDSSLTEEDIRHHLAEEGWEPVEMAIVRTHLTAAPAFGAYIEPAGIGFPTRTHEQERRVPEAV